MFAMKDQDQQKNVIVSGSKGLDDQPSASAVHTSIGSLWTLQRTLGNSCLQAIAPTIQPTASISDGLLLQRACACGSSCANCSETGDEPSILQPKLMIGSPHDQYEREADLMANQVMQMSTPATLPIQRQAEEEEPEAIQMQPLAASITPIIQAAVEVDHVPQTAPNFVNQLNASQNNGSPLPRPVRSFMEARFGTHFGQVRVHVDNDAVQMNRALGAQAFTHGNHIYFGSGKTPENNHLTAHELTHVIQQNGTTHKDFAIQKKRWRSGCA